MARIPVSGVRTSWANAASAASTMPGPAVTAARLRALPAARAGTRCFDIRFFGIRVGRFARDLTAMIPPTLAGLTMPWSAARSHEGRFRRRQAEPAGHGQADPAADVGRRRALRPEFAKSGRRCRLRQLPPLAVEHEAVVPVGRLRQTEQMLQQPVHAGRPEQVRAPHHLGDALQGVVDHNREMIAGRRLLAREDDVAPGLQAGPQPPRRSRRRDLRRARSSRDRGPARAPPPCRAAAHRACRNQAGAPARPAPATSPPPDRAARRRDRAASGACASRCATSLAISARLSNAG